MQTTESVEQENFGLVAGQDLEKQSNPAGLPHGWYKVITASGKDAGLTLTATAARRASPTTRAKPSSTAARWVRPGTLRELSLPIHTIRPIGIAWI